MRLVCQSGRGKRLRQYYLQIQFSADNGTEGIHYLHPDILIFFRVCALSICSVPLALKRVRLRLPLPLPLLELFLLSSPTKKSAIKDTDARWIYARRNVHIKESFRPRSIYWVRFERMSYYRGECRIKFWTISKMDDRGRKKWSGFAIKTLLVRRFTALLLISRARIICNGAKKVIRAPSKFSRRVFFIKS